jgi:hypothetical protein
MSGWHAFLLISATVEFGVAAEAAINCPYISKLRMSLNLVGAAIGAGGFAWLIW